VTSLPDHRGEAADVLLEPYVNAFCLAQSARRLDG